MSRFTPQERGIIVTIFLRNNSSVVLAQREFCRRFPGRPPPTGQTLRRLATRLEETGATRDLPKAGRPRSSRCAENIAAVAQDVEEKPGTSTRRRATQLGISRRSLRRILVTDLKMRHRVCETENRVKMEYEDNEEYDEVEEKQIKYDFDYASEEKVETAE